MNKEVMSEMSQLLEEEVTKDGKPLVEITKDDEVSVPVNQKMPLYLNLEPDWQIIKREQNENRLGYHTVPEDDSLSFLHKHSAKFSFTNETQTLSATNQKQGNILEELNINEEND